MANNCNASRRIDRIVRLDERRTTQKPPRLFFPEFESWLAETGDDLSAMPGRRVWCYYHEAADFLDLAPMAEPDFWRAIGKAGFQSYRETTGKRRRLWALPARPADAVDPSDRAHGPFNRETVLAIGRAA